MIKQLIFLCLNRYIKIFLIYQTVECSSVNNDNIKHYTYVEIHQVFKHLRQHSNLFLNLLLVN